MADKRLSLADTVACKQIQLRVEDLSREQLEQERARLRLYNPNAMVREERAYYNEVMSTLDQANAEE